MISKVRKDKSRRKGDKIMSNYIKMYTNPRFGFEKEEADRLKEMILTGAKAKRGVIRWENNKKCLPTDCAEFAQYLGFKVDMEAQKRAQDRDLKQMRKNYIKARAEMTQEEKDEEMYEMRAAFGRGAVVVNILTGERFVV